MSTFINTLSDGESEHNSSKVEDGGAVLDKGIEIDSSPATSPAYTSTSPLVGSGDSQVSSRRPSWDQIDRAHVDNDLLIFKALDQKRRKTLEQTREAGVPVKLDLHLKIMINSHPLFSIDKDVAEGAIRARRYSLDAFKYSSYGEFAEFAQGCCREMWRLAKNTVEKEGDANAVNTALVDQDGKWLGKLLNYGDKRAMLKLEEDGAIAELTVGRTTIAGDSSNMEKEQQYREWYWRNVEKGCLGQYMVEYTIDMVQKPLAIRQS